MFDVRPAAVGNSGSSSQLVEALAAFSPLQGRKNEFNCFSSVKNVSLAMDLCFLLEWYTYQYSIHLFVIHNVNSKLNFQRKRSSRVSSYCNEERKFIDESRSRMIFIGGFDKVEKKIFC